MRPVAGERGQSFDLLLPTSATCPTDAVRWHTFIMPLASDPSQLRYESGVLAVDGSTTRIRPLFSSGIEVIDQRLDAIGTISANRYYQFYSYPGGTFTSGPYRIGVACTDAAGRTVRYWQNLVGLEVDLVGVVRWASYGLPAAPVLGSPRLGDSGRFEASITVEPASPPISAVVVTATSTNGGVDKSITITDLSEGTKTIAIDGLTNGYQYVLQAVAQNDLGTSPPSGALTATVYDFADTISVGNLAVTVTNSTATVSWTAPTSGSPTAYRVTVSPSVTGSPFTTTSTSISIGGIPPTSVSFTVLPIVSPPLVAAPLTVSIDNSDGTGQTVAVGRPPGFLGLTQTCGRFGALPVEPASPGFPALAATPATGTRTAPSLDPTGLTPDPGFAAYPWPTNGAGGGPMYPTYCQVDLGAAQLVVDGPESGKYFASSGRLNQLTVVDSRPEDSGWTLNISVSDFVGPGATFSGGYLGWTPATATIGESAYDGYQQVVTPGNTVLPDPGRTNTTRVLARAVAGSGLGLATVDARFKVLIPLTARSGTYRTTVTITIV